MLSIVVEMIVLLLAGVVAGALAAISGLGGGLVLVPALSLVAGLNMEAAIATSLIVMVANTIRVSRSVYNIQQAVISRSGWMELMAVIIALITAIYSDLLPSQTLKTLFAVVMILVSTSYAYRMLHNCVVREPKQTNAKIVKKVDTISPSRHWDKCALACGASLTGAAAGLLGIGGGIVLVPILQRHAHLSVRQAAAAAIYVMGAAAAVAAVILLPKASLFAAACCVFGLKAGNKLGKLFLAAVSDRVLEVVVVLLLLTIALRMLLT